MAKYLKQGIEETYTEDSAEIQYLKFNMARHSALGFMLGDFDERGEYVIDLEIVKELIAMPKYFVDSMENIDVCHSVLVINSPITFLVTFENDTATLSIIEKLSLEGNFKFNSGSYSNINEYVLDRVKTSGTIDKNAVYNRWHISQFGGNSLDIHNLDEEQLQMYFGIVSRFKYLLYANSMFAEKEEELEIAEANYTKNLMELISRYPELEKAVAEQLKQALEKKSILQLDKPNFAKTLNEVLDFAVEINLQSLSPKEQQEFLTERHNIQNERNIKAEQAVELKNNAYDVLGKEIPIAKPVVDTLNAEATLSIFALDEQLKSAQTKAYANAQKRAIDIITGIKKAKVAGELVGLMMAIAGEIKNKTDQDITENIDDSTMQFVNTTKSSTKQNAKGLLGKAVAEEKNAATSTKTDIKKEDKKPDKKVDKKPDKNAGKNAGKKADNKAGKKAGADKPKTITPNAKQPAANVSGTGYIFTPESKAEGKGLIAQEVKPNQNNDDVTAKPVNLADIFATMNAKRDELAASARKTGVKTLLSNADVKPVNSTVDANVSNLNVEEEGTTLNR